METGDIRDCKEVFLVLIVVINIIMNRYHSIRNWYISNGYTEKVIGLYPEKSAYNFLQSCFE